MHSESCPQPRFVAQLVSLRVARALAALHKPAEGHSAIYRERAGGLGTLHSEY